MLDDWQSWFLDESLAEDRRHRWSAFEVALLVSRQCGKGSILEARQLGGLTLLDERLQVHTAHEYRTCYEHFLRMVTLVESCPDIERQVMRIRRGGGEHAIEMRGKGTGTTGNRLRFLARSGGSGRGMSGDAVYLDEAFALTSAMMGALLPTLSARPNPQVWYASSAPMARSEVLHDIRKRGMAGSSDRLFFAEWSCEAGADPDVVDNWYQANPALGIRISEEFVRSELDAMSGQPDEFARERLGIADQSNAETVGPIPFDVWEHAADEGSKIVSHHAWALAVTPDRRWASLGIAGRTVDGKLHVEWAAHEPFTGWIVDRVASAWADKRIPIRIHKQGPEAAFIAPLRERGVEVVEVSTPEVAQATGQVIDAVNSGTLVHLGQRSLNKALRGAVLRITVDGASLWSQRQSEVEITPLQAVTVAAGGVPDVQPVVQPGYYGCNGDDEEVL